ncbi:hypothetical protein, partial [Klebsiella pneumoniae]|uniref:hypothetical protein n=1 Tax=Klebsiella pneumoniae TaxID=573 RepID=UPI0023B2AFA6
LHGDVLMWLMKTLLTSRCINQRGAGQRPALRPGLWCLLVLNPESEKFADSDGRLIASGLWQQQRLRKLANYRQEEPE